MTKVALPRGAVYVASALTALPMLVLLWAGPTVPSHDGPEHLAAVVLWRGVHAGTAPITDHLLANTIASPWLQTWFLQVFWGVLGPIAAQKLFLTLYLLGLPLAATYLRRGLERPRAPSTGLLSGLLASMLGPSWCFFMGFFNFLASVPFALLLVGVWARHLESPRRRRALALALLFPLTGLAHPLGLAVAGLVTGLVALTGADRWRALGRLLALSAGGWLLLGAVAWKSLAVGADTWAGRPLRLPSSEVLAGVVNFTVGGPTPVLYLLAVPLLAALGFSLWAARRWTAGQRHAAQGLALAAAAMATVYALAPFHAESWSYVQPRFGLFMLLFFACLAGLDWSRFARAAVTVAAAVTPLVAFGPFARAYLQAADDSAAVARAAEHVPAGSLVLPIIFEPESAWADRWQRPLEHAGSYATVFTGSVTPYHMAVHPSANAVLFRDGRRSLPEHPPLWVGALDGCGDGERVEDCLVRRRSLHERLVFQLRGFDAALLWRPPPEIVIRLRERAAELLYVENGALVVAPRLGAVVLDLAEAPPDLPVVTTLLDADGEIPLLFGHVPAGSREVSIEPLLAGPYVLRVAADTDANNTLGPADAPALGGIAPGEYAILVRPGQVLRLHVPWPRQPTPPSAPQP